MKSIKNIIAVAALIAIFAAPASAQVIEKNVGNLAVDLSDPPPMCIKVEASILYRQYTPKDVQFGMPELRDGLNLVWDFGDGHFSNENYPVHEYKRPGVYTVTLKVYNACGLADMRQAQVIISAVKGVDSMR